MRTPFGWALPRPISLQALCACLVLWSMPCASLGTTGQIAAVPAASTPAPTVASATGSQSTVQTTAVSFERREWALLAIVFLVGMLAGWARRGPSKPRVRLLTKPQKARPTVLVPPGLPPRLVPGESPNATRARPTPAPVLRKAPAGTGSGIIDYIAPFAGAGESSGKARVDYLLEPGDTIEPAGSPPGSV